MSNKITIEYTGAEIIERLMRLSQAMSPTGLRTVLDQIGHDLTESTKRRFSTSTAPDGTPWAPNSNAAMASYLGTAKSNYKKDGTLSKRGEKRQAGKRPLVALGTLARSITWQLVPEGVEIGSPMIYAGTHQFGAKQGQYGRDRRNHPLPWGDIPARPFLGLSADDESTITTLIDTHLNDALN
ncbi:virion morphogenesis protein [Betaproteobacteria bacterium]|nr:virion morphogenesis protein [Betaproteobacteria bacterium]